MSSRHRITLSVSFEMDEMDDPNPEASAEIATTVLEEVLAESTAWKRVEAVVTSCTDA